MKKMLLVTIVLVLVVLCGCDTTSKQRIEWLQQSLDTVTKESAKIGSDMQLLRDTITDLKAAANDPGLQQAEAEKIAGYLTAASEKMSAATIAKARADKVIADTKAVISKIDAGQANVGTELQAVGDVMQGAGSAVPPPYGTLITIGGLLVGAVGGVIGKRKNDALKVADAETKRKNVTLIGVVKSVDVAKETMDDDAKSAFVEVMKDSQKDLSVDREAIRKIRAQGNK